MDHLHNLLPVRASNYVTVWRFGGHKTKCLIVVAYKPPNVTSHAFTLDMTTLLDRATRDYSDIWVIGDLNFDLLDRTKSETLRDVCDIYGLDQLIKEPTNTTIHGSSLIDVILTTVPTKTSSSGSTNVGLSDTHNMIYTTLKLKAPRLPPTTITYRDYKHFREDEYSADVSKIPETVCQIFDDPSDNYWALQLLLTDVINEHAPLKTTKVKAREVPFMNKRLKRAVREKTRTYNQYRKRPTPANWEQYRLQRNLTVTIRRDAIKAYFNDKCAGGAKNTDFWPTIKPFLTNKGAGGKSIIMVRVNDKIITDPAHVSQHMNDFYVNIASKIGGDIDVNQTSECNTDFVTKCVNHFSDHPSVTDITNTMKTAYFSFRHTTPTEVEKIMQSLDTKKATGPDRIPAKLIKPAAGPLSHQLTKVFNQCVDNNEFPSDAKLADVVPVHKKNDNLNIMNYRPVSILSSMSKVLEKLILRQMTPFLRKILDPRIAAYRQGYRCQDVLLRLVEDWKRALENRKHVGAVLMDLSKAFDCLPHQLLVAKLRAYGACDRSCALIWSYLSGRRQRVRIGCSTSDWLPLTKGVPQGSVLAPVLFNIFINDLYAAITKSTLYNYADDNTISACCDTEQLVVETLTSEVKVAIKWFDTNRMEANPSKFQAITVNAAEDPRAHINLGDKVIIAESTVKLLGVHLDDHLNFNQQTKELCRKAASQLNVLQRLARHLDQGCRMSIFRAFILTHFNYCALVWHFCGATNTKKLERIQCRALRFVFLDFNSDYTTLLVRAGLPTLELARKREILVEVYKAVMHLSPPFMWGLFTQKLTRYNLRNSNQLNIPHSNTTKYGLRSFSTYGATLWNSLPGHIKSCGDLNSFKTCMQTWQDIPCKCNMCK